LCGCDGHGEVGGGGGKKVKNRKITAMLAIFMGIISLTTGLRAKEKDLGSLPNRKFLYIFNIADRKTLTKTIERSGQYTLKALIRPKTVTVKRKYKYPLDIKIPQDAPSFKISKIDKGISIINQEGYPETKLVFPDWVNLKIDTYVYPFFYLEYESEKPLNINLHFYVDFDNDGVDDFMVYYGKEPDKSITSKIKCYPVTNYFKHNIKDFQKNITIRLYDELRLKRPDRISFILRKVHLEIITDKESQRYILKNINLYNEEPRNVSMVVKRFEDERGEKGNLEGDGGGETNTLNLYDFLERRNEVEPLINPPIFEIKNSKYYLKQLDKDIINEILRKRTEISFGRLYFEEGENVSLTPFKNDYVELENVFLSEEFKDVGKEPILTFKRVNPTRYIVDVEAENSFWITLSENFHSGWKAYIITDNTNSAIGNEKAALQFALNAKGKLIPLKEHRVVNAFANGWFVPVSEIFKGNKPFKFRIVMEFYPQRLYEIGIILSSIFFVLMLIWAMVGLTKKKFRGD
jgi:hypothetical protein